MDRTEQFDFAFIDADKTEYIDYFEEASAADSPERRDHDRQHAPRRIRAGARGLGVPPG